MAEIIKRILRLLNKLGAFSVYYKMKYNGKGVSLNDYYSQGHWTQRDAIKRKYSKIAKEMISVIPDGEFFEQFALIVFYWSKHDPDNVAGFEKIIMDELKSSGFIRDDSRSFYKLFAVIPDESLNHNDFQFYMIKIK